MIKKIDFDDSVLIRTLFELQKASYTVEASIIKFYDIPPLKETFEAFQNCGENFLGYFEDRELAGAISFQEKDNLLTICRMVVHPVHHRKGIAQKLLRNLEMRQGHCNKFTVATGRDNYPAKNLYLKNGYKWLTDKEVDSNFYISLFEKIKR